MNKLSPVSEIMKTDLITVSTTTLLSEAYPLFQKNDIHHLPVTQYKKIVGILSKLDFLKLLEKTQNLNLEADIVELVNMAGQTVESIMTKGVGKIESIDTIRTAIDIFSLNQFHALPVVDNDELVGIVTVFDILEFLKEEKIGLKDYEA